VTERAGYFEFHPMVRETSADIAAVSAFVEGVRAWTTCPPPRRAFAVPGSVITAMADNDGASRSQDAD